MSRVLVIGCGGVANVAIRKCCQVSDVFTELCIASRTKSKCDKLAAELAGKTATKITTCEGLGGPVKRTNICKLGFHVQDVIFLLICLGAFAAQIYVLAARG